MNARPRLPGSRRARLLLVAALLAAGIGLAVQALGLLSQLSLESVDARFSFRGAQRPPHNIALVTVDFKTLHEAPPAGLGLRWPFPRRYHAQLIDDLRRAGARAIVFDVEFVFPTDPRDDNALLESIAHAGDVVLAASAVGAHGSTDVLGGEQTLRTVHAVPGFSIFPTDRGGVVRRMYYEWRGLPSLGVAAATKVLGHPPPRRNLRSDGTAWIDYPGPAGTIPAISYADVIRHRVPASEFAGKVVVVGASDPTLQDIHATSTTHSTALMSGPELQAAAIATALNGFPLRSASGLVTVLAILVLAATPALLAFRLSAVRALGVTLLAGAVFAVAAQIAFDGNLVVAVVTPLLALLASGVGCLGVNYLDEAFHRQATRLAFARFVPEAVVDEVLATTGGGIRLGGVRRIATVMFSDLRGFTSFSERRDPEQVIEILNRYLTEMSDAILGHGGTLVAYMGDGIMAVFGAPLTQDDHADRALRAACEMLERLTRFNEWLAAEHGAQPLRMGIGLNTGPVMSGNVGSDRRLEYTALGDTTNTAARLEGMTKGTPHQLFLAESTREALVEPRRDLEFVDEMEVRGRETRIRIWTLAGAPQAPEDQQSAPHVQSPTP